MLLFCGRIIRGHATGQAQDTHQQTAVMNVQHQVTMLADVQCSCAVRYQSVRNAAESPGWQPPLSPCIGTLNHLGAIIMFGWCTNVQLLCPPPRPVRPHQPQTPCVCHHSCLKGPAAEVLCGEPRHVLFGPQTPKAQEARQQLSVDCMDRLHLCELRGSPSRHWSCTLSAK
jgi:hypothetical protein